MKRVLSGLLALALLVCGAVPALAEEKKDYPPQTTTQMVHIDQTLTVFFMYTVYDSNGFATNYVKLRDVAWALNGTAKQFNVDYDGSTKVTTGMEYIPDGSEVVPLNQNATAEGLYRAVLTVDGVGHPLDAYLIRPQGAGDGNFYFKLRDLGAAIGFTVGWSADRGVYIETA